MMGKKKVLFICEGNVLRSQAAKLYFNRFSKAYEAISTGIDTYRYGGRKISEFAPGLVEKMKRDYGLDFSACVPTHITPEIAEQAHWIVSFVKEHRLPDYVLDRDVRYWDVEDPRGRPEKVYDKVIGEIRAKVSDLVKELDV